MNSTAITTAAAPSPALAERWARRLTLNLLARLAHGRLTLEDGGERLQFGSGEPAAVVQVHNPALYAAVVRRGSIGAAESYMRGEWSSPDLTAVIRVLAINADLLAQLDRGEGARRLLLAGPRLALRLYHRLRRNSRVGSRANISAHYDLGNEFYRLFLDDTLMYSAAVFPAADSTLEEASRHKLERICRRLQLQPGDHLLEIGTGWGGLALHAARHFGCRVTTTTLSRQQYDYARQRVQAAGLAERVEVLLRDYRDLEGRYDKLVSVEMIEAVGHEYYPAYFSQCARLLKPEGMMLLQAITIADQRYERARHSVDFIQRYIFPGGCLPSTAAIAGQVARHTDFTLVGLDDITQHYARTLAAWRERFMGQLDAVRRLGFDETFIRMWEFYLCYCEGGFRERSIGTQQILLAKPGCRLEPALSAL